MGASSTLELELDIDFAPQWQGLAGCLRHTHLLIHTVCVNILITQVLAWILEANNTQAYMLSGVTAGYMSYTGTRKGIYYYFYFLLLLSLTVINSVWIAYRFCKLLSLTSFRHTLTIC